MEMEGAGTVNCAWLPCHFPCSKDTVLQHFSDLGMKEVTPKCVAKLLGEEGMVDLSPAVP